MQPMTFELVINIKPQRCSASKCPRSASRAPTRSSN